MNKSVKSVVKKKVLPKAKKNQNLNGLHNSKQNDKWTIQDSTELYSICLLYKSPSPRDRTRYRMPSSA